jgi:hypothetical protein
MSNIGSVKNLDIELYELLRDIEIYNDSYGYYFIDKDGFKIHITGERKYSKEKIKQILTPKRIMTQNENDLIIKYADALLKENFIKADKIMIELEKI